MNRLINRRPARSTGVERVMLNCIVAIFALAFAANFTHGALTLEDAVLLAQEGDPWIEGSKHQERALTSQSTAAGTFPDPLVSAGFANLPTDTFDFDQEAMTQFKVGISQAIPRGDSLQLRQHQLHTLGRQHPYRRADRRGQLEAEVSSLWLDAWRARESIHLIQQDRNLFEQLVDVAQSNYSSALGGTRQQDLIRAQLELTRLDDRLVLLNQEREVTASRLSNWVNGAQWLPDPDTANVLDEKLPDISQRGWQFVQAEREPSPQELAERFSSHPAVLALDRKLAASSTGIELAEQRYKPEWRLNASYGYRDDDPLGNDRSDFFSVGVSFDLPVFTSRRQDQQVQSAASMAEAVRTERALLLRKMIADFYQQRARLLRLNQRRVLYESRLLLETREQAEASLSAYTNDDGDFAEVVRAKIAELNARIDKLGIDVDRQKAIARLNYFFISSALGED